MNHLYLFTVQLNYSECTHSDWHIWKLKLKNLLGFKKKILWLWLKWILHHSEWLYAKHTHVLPFINLLNDMPVEPNSGLTVLVKYILILKVCFEKHLKICCMKLKLLISFKYLVHFFFESTIHPNKNLQGNHRHKCVTTWIETFGKGSCQAQVQWPIVRRWSLKSSTQRLEPFTPSHASNWSLLLSLDWNDWLMA